jgi:hypothetical protein
MGAAQRAPGGPGAAWPHPVWRNMENGRPARMTLSDCEHGPSRQIHKKAAVRSRSADIVTETLELLKLGLTYETPLLNQLDSGNPGCP